MINTPARSLVFATAVVACTLLVCAQALAASPVKGARYHGSGEDYSVTLKVANERLALAPRGSTVDGACVAGVVHLGSRARAVRVSSSGRFRFERATRRFVLRISGVVKSKRARVRVAYRQKSSRSPRGCRRTLVEKLSLRPIVPFRDCRTHPGETVLEGPRSRVFLSHPDELDYRYAVACLYSRNKPVELGLDIDGDPDVGLYRLAGPYVAYAESSCEGLGPCLSDVIVRDLRTGKASFRAAPPSDPFDQVSDLVLTENGAVAWIAQPKSLGGTPPASLDTTLWASDGQGSKVLASGDGIDPRSLELAGSTLTWLKDGVPMTATLG